MMPKSVQIVGPYFTNYSLAKLNRNLARAIKGQYNDISVTLYCPPDRIDKLPSKEELDKNPHLSSLVSFDSVKTDVAIYNNFPKSTSNLHGLENLNADLKLIYIAWEDTVYPSIWVDEINKFAHGVMATSTFVKDVLIQSGVKVPIKVVLNAVDLDLKTTLVEPYKLNTKKKFKFLHISTAKYRKGVDVLLRAYFKTFNAQDDCTLVIKSSPGPDNLVEQLLTQLERENSPEVIHINSSELTEAELKGLLTSSDCCVYPTRGEGFGLPLLESMEYGVPLITTGYSGHMDFCNEQNSYLLDYKLKIASENELVNLNSYWAEPNEEQLGEFLKQVYDAKIKNATDLLKEMKLKVALAKESASLLSWESSAHQTLEYVESLNGVDTLRNQKIAVMTFLNDQTGINFYSKELYKNIENLFKEFYFLANSDIADRTELDNSNVVRNWSVGGEDFKDLLKFIEERSINIIHIQHHPGAFSPSSLNTLLESLSKHSIRVYVTLHAVRSQTFDLIKECTALQSVDKVIIHNKEDYEYASKTIKNAYLMRIPRLKFKKRIKSKLRDDLNLSEYSPIVATHGLLNSNKGVSNILESISILKTKLPKIYFLGLSAVSPNNIMAGSLFKELNEQIKKLHLEKHVTLVPQFLDRSVVEMLLQSADINVLAYVDTAGESASAAVEKTMASGNPTIVTDIKAFEELDSEVLKIKDNQPVSISNAILKLLEDKDISSTIVKNAESYIEKNSYLEKSLETLSVYLLNP